MQAMIEENHNLLKAKGINFTRKKKDNQSQTFYLEQEDYIASVH